MAAGQVYGRWFEAAFVAVPCFHHLGFLLIGLEDNTLGAIFAMFFLIPAIYDRKSIHVL